MTIEYTETFTAQNMVFPDCSSILRRGHKRSMRRGKYEGKELSAATALFTSDDRVLEMGAGIGYVSTFLVKSIGVKSVLSFEANPALIPYIEEVYRLNDVQDKTDVRNAIVALNSSEPIPFYVRGDFLASSFADDMGEAHGGIVQTVNLSTAPIDEVIDDYKPTALMCDIEGAEVDIIPNMNLSNINSAVIELHPSTIGNGGVKSIFDAFSKAGMAYFAGGSHGQVVSFVRI